MRIHCMVNGRPCKGHCEEALYAHNWLIVSECKKLLEENMEEVCWICEGLGDSREHSLKRSDVKQWLSKPIQKKPLYYSSEYYFNKRINTLNDDLLTWNKLICRKCNNERTQPYDMAWQTLSRELFQLNYECRVPKYINLAKIFHENCHKKSIYIQMYFAKYLGCAVNSFVSDGLNKIHILRTLSAHLMSAEACQNLYIKLINNKNGKKSIGSTGLIIHTDERKNEIIRAGVNYYFGKFLVEVIYTSPSMEMFFSKGAWNPRFGTKIRVTTESLGNRVTSIAKGNKITPPEYS